MTLEHAFFASQIVAAIAVLVSLIFVIIELRQNRLATRGSTTQAHIANWVGVLTPIIEHADVARIWRLGISDINTLTEDERVRFIILVAGIFRFIEGARLQWLQGHLDGTHWTNLERNLRDIASQPGFKSYWAMRRHWYTDDFRAWYEAAQTDEVRPMYDVQKAAAI